MTRNHLKPPDDSIDDQDIPATSFALHTLGIVFTKPLMNSVLLQTHAMSVKEHPEVLNAVKIGDC